MEGAYYKLLISYIKVLFEIKVLIKTLYVDRLFTINKMFMEEKI